MDPGNVTVLVGEATSLRCLAAGTPSPSITWTRDVVGNGPVLLFHSTKFSDSGWYRCSATNAIGSSVSSRAYLDVAGKYIHALYRPYCSRRKLLKVSQLV